MRVLLVDGSERGGIARYTDVLAADLARQGVDVHVAAPGARALGSPQLPGQPWGGEVQDRTTLHRVRRRIGETARRIRAFVRCVRAVRPDLVHLQTDVARHLDPFLLRLLRVPVVITVHNAVPHEDERRELRRLSLLWRAADCLIVHGGQARDAVLAIVPGASVVVIPVEDLGPGCGLTQSEARARLEVDDGPVALLLGLVRQYKGIGLLADAWPGVLTRVPTARLAVIGSLPAPFPDVERLTSLPGVLTRFEWLSEEEVDLWAAAADVTLLPYAHGAHSGVLHRSIANGTPVLASPPLAEEATRLAAGRVVELDAAKWADAIADAFEGRGIEPLRARPRVDTTATVIATYRSVIGATG